MNHNTLRKIHAAAGVGAFLFIASLWSNTVFSGLFDSHETVAAVKRTIAYMLLRLTACMTTTGTTSMKMGDKSRHAAITAKRRRMPFIAANGVLILLPRTFFLNSRAATGQFDSVFCIIRSIELITGVTNLTLLGLGTRDGFSIRKSKQKSTPLHVQVMSARITR